MYHDRIAGSTQTLRGRVKAFVGHLFGDTKLQAEGQMDQLEGRIQAMVGGLKGSMRDDERRQP